MIKLFALAFSILGTLGIMFASSHGVSGPTLFLGVLALVIVVSSSWAVVMRRRTQARVDPLSQGGVRLSPIWLASPQHLARVETLWRTFYGEGKVSFDLPNDFPSVTLALGRRFPVLFEAIGTLELVGGRAVFRPDSTFLKGGTYRNIKQDVALEFAIPAEVQLHTVDSPVSAQFSTDWLRLSNLDVEPVMICVGAPGPNAQASRDMTRQLHELLQGAPANPG